MNLKEIKIFKKYHYMKNWIQIQIFQMIKKKNQLKIFLIRRIRSGVYGNKNLNNILSFKNNKNL